MPDAIWRPSSSSRCRNGQAHSHPRPPITSCAPQNGDIADIVGVGGNIIKSPICPLSSALASTLDLFPLTLLLTHRFYTVFLEESATFANYSSQPVYHIHHIQYASSSTCLKLLPSLPLLLPPPLPRPVLPSTTLARIAASNSTSRLAPRPGLALSKTAPTSTSDRSFATSRNEPKRRMQYTALCADSLLIPSYSERTKTTRTGSTDSVTSSASSVSDSSSH